MFDLTTLDYVYVGLVLASTVWASIRGGVYETVTMFAWLIAALAARFVSPFLGGLFQSWFGLPEPTIGTLVASYFIVFFVILLTFSFFNQKLRDRVQESMMRLTDHTLGIVFGIIRGIVVMGFVYWGLLWYYSDTPLPVYVTEARTRPIMQLTIVKINQWFIPGHNKLLDEDAAGFEATEKDFENMINPTVVNVGAGSSRPAEPAPKEKKPKKEPVRDKKSAAADSEKLADAEPEHSGDHHDIDIGTGYKDSERDSLENKILQIESVEE